MLNGKNIVVGLCGGIAAYKAAEVVRYIKKNNATVNIIMTKNSLNFITPLTMQTLSGNPVTSDMFEETKDWDIKHISLASKADLIIVMPATANIIGKIANGIADDMLTTTIMATKAKVLFVPAMNVNMYENPIVTENIIKLKNLGYFFTEPGIGSLACGVDAKGRFPELDIIISKINEFTSVKNSKLSGKKVLITAGPTIEEFDPVRYFTNPSTGKMGYAIAREAHERGAIVKLVTGPTNISVPGGVEYICVKSAEEMYNAVLNEYSNCDISIFTAAVSDYRPKVRNIEKIKKENNTMQIEMVKNPDIALEMSKIKEKQINIGFCAETEKVIENAKEKLINKGFDFIVANDITKEGAGFGTDTNIVSIINKFGDINEYNLMSKDDLAVIIIDEIEKII